MDDIRLFETDGDYLVLEAQDGQKYRLLVDDTVRSSVKKERIALLDSVTITPREIQEEIRNGASIEDLISKSGATFEYIEKFAAPVIAELEHIVSSALSVRLTIAGDRYSDSTQIEFGEIIAGRLITSGASGISWVAKKIEPSNWNITAHYQLNGSNGSATWGFDPRRLTLSPESETAVTLSTQETISSTPIPKLRTVAPETSGFTEETPLTSNVELSQTVAMEDVIPFVRAVTPETPIAVEPPPIVSVPKIESPATEEPLSATADLLEALRRKRTEREAEFPNPRDEVQLQPHPVSEDVRVIDFDPAQIDPEPQDSSQTTQQPDVESPKPAQKKGRAAMPSWDEIVFGTKADD